MLGEHEVAGSNPVIPTAVHFMIETQAQVLELVDNRPRDGRAREGLRVRIPSCAFFRVFYLAQVLELVDNRVSEARARLGVRVRAPPCAFF